MQHSTLDSSIVQKRKRKDNKLGDDDDLIDRIKRMKLCEGNVEMGVGIPQSIHMISREPDKVIRRDTTMDKRGVLGSLGPKMVVNRQTITRQHRRSDAVPPNVSSAPQQRVRVIEGNKAIGIREAPVKVGLQMVKNGETSTPGASLTSPTVPISIRAPPSAPNERLDPELAYPFQPCGIPIFNLPGHSPNAAFEEAKRILRKVPDLQIIRNGITQSVHRSVFEVVPGSMGESEHIPVSNAIIRIKLSIILSGPYVDHLAIGALRKTLLKAGLECRWNGSEGSDRCTMGLFVEDTTNIPCPTEPDQLKKWTKRFFVDKLGEKGDMVASTWNVVKSKQGEAGSDVHGSIGMKSPARLDKLVKELPYIPNKAGAPTTGVGYRVAHSYIPPTYYTTIAVLLSNKNFEGPDPTVSLPLQNQLKAFLDSMVVKWKSDFPHDTNEYIIRTGITTCGRFFTADPTSPLLAEYICDHRSPTEYYFDFVYHLNSNISQYSFRELNRTTREKNRAFRHRWEKYHKWNVYM